MCRNGDGVIDCGLQRRYRMGRTIMLCGQAKDERQQEKTDGPLLFRGQDKNLAANLFPRRTFHFGRGLTCRDRYLPRMFS